MHTHSHTITGSIKMMEQRVVAWVLFGADLGKIHVFSVQCLCVRERTFILDVTVCMTWPQAPAILETKCVCVCVCVCMCLCVST